MILYRLCVLPVALAGLLALVAAVTGPFEVAVNARQRVDLALEVGDVLQSVEVTGAAAVLETDSSDRGRIVGRQAIANLPLNGRAYADLALLTPGVRKPALAQNQFGATVGGPIRKNRLFCFADYEGFRRVTRQLTYASLPTADQRAGRFGVLVQNPYTGAIYSGGVIPQSEIAEFARKVMADLPGNVRSATSNNIESLPRSATTDNKGDARLDYHHSSRVTLP